MPAGPPPDRVGLPAIDPPSLCEAGPCRNYHRLVSAMDAADPVGETGPMHQQVSRACYPTPGIELELGEVPVFQCSRWEPESSATSSERDRARTGFLRSSEGKAFSAEVAAFEQATSSDDDMTTEATDPQEVNS